MNQTSWMQVPRGLEWLGWCFLKDGEPLQHRECFEDDSGEQWTALYVAKQNGVNVPIAAVVGRPFAELMCFYPQALAYVRIAFAAGDIGSKEMHRCWCLEIYAGSERRPNDEPDAVILMDNAELGRELNNTRLVDARDPEKIKWMLELIRSTRQEVEKDG